MSEYRPYRRAQPANWWARPPYLAYTLRELTGVGIALYAAVLLAGLIALVRGPDAFAGFTRWLASPVSLVLHLLLLAVMIWHVITWFRILPKTMPKLVFGNEPVSQQHISRAALAVGIACSVLLVIVVMIAGALT